MCGIFGIIGNKQNAAELTLEALKTLEYRGYDSWGVAALSETNPQILVEKHIGKISVAQTTLPAAQIAIGHTRWATHGGVTDLNAHPHLNQDASIAVVHNGIVENYQELKSHLLQNGYQFISQTDTEVIAHLLDFKFKQNGDFVRAVCTTFNSLIGSNAIVALNAKNQEIVACRDGSPLVVGASDNECLLASDTIAILPYTNRIYYLKDGESVSLKDKKVSIYNTKTQDKIDFSFTETSLKQEETTKNGYPHFMLKEIMQEREVVIDALRSPKIAPDVANIIKSANRIFIIGCGSAYNCAQAATYYFAKSGLHTQAIAANEFQSFVSLCDEHTLVVAVSQSGETADTLVSSRAALARGASLIALVNARGSSLERIATHTINVLAGPEISVVSTKAFMCQLTTLVKIAHDLEGKNLSASQISADLNTILDPQYIAKINDMASHLVDTQDIYVIGKGPLAPLAVEAALKIKEASYIHAEGFASGELKHGVIALVQTGTPILVLGDIENKADIVSAAMQVKARGGRIYAIADFEDPSFDILIKTPSDPVFTPLYITVLAQLLGYTLSVARGADPDRPRNLAKSVTVK